MSDPQYVGLKSLEQVNKVRRENGLREIKYIIRKCLKCKKQFKALGANNYMCGCVSESDLNDVP